VAVLIVYLGFFSLVAGIGVLIANPIANQIEQFQKDVPRLVRDANSSLADAQRWLDDNGIGVHIKASGQTALQTIQKNVLKGSGSIVSFTRDLVSKIVTLSFALILILVISIYMLLSAEGIGRIARFIMPPGDGTPEDDYCLRIQRAVFSYVRGQALFSLIMGSSAAICLYIFGVLGIFPDGENYAVFFGAFYGLMEFVPYVGPVIGALPAIVVALFQDPISAVWVALLFIVLQQLEGHVVAPQVFGHSLRINPLLVIAALLIGEALYGIIGALVALPIAAVIRETVVYLRQHVVFEPWDTRAPPPAGGGGDPPPTAG
jgi:predicted PurR-regulated permease PerM